MIKKEPEVIPLVPFLSSLLLFSCPEEDVFDGYVKFLTAKNLLEVDLDNLNYTLHPFPVLLNYGDIEKNPSTFRHYMDGITPILSEKMEALDLERLEIGKKLGIELQSCLLFMII